MKTLAVQLERKTFLKILFWGDSPTVPTGFGKVSNEVLKRLRSYGHDISILGINHNGDPYDHEEFPYRLYPCAQGNTDMLYGLSKLWAVVQHEKPDLLFMLNDPWLIKDTLDRKPGEYPYMKTLAYYPVDAGPLKPEWIKILNSFDAQVCYSHFAERVVTDSNKGKRPDNLYQIYHGVNTETYYPINQQKARAVLGIPNDVFIVGMVARNQPRKRFDILMKAFVDFAKDKDDARLYLHTAMHDFGFDMPDLIRQFDIGDKLILTEGLTPARGVDEERLNLIYNTFDVNALISLGDGFGLPVAESMATGCPQLVSGHSCLQELVEGHGGLTVNTQSWLLNGSEINTWGGLSDPDDIATKLNILYNNQALRIKLSEDGYNFIRQEQFSWDSIAQQFQKIIKKIFHLI
jgi:glycosyltransferase involved in cell wall biosynthesis